MNGFHRASCKSWAAAVSAILCASLFVILLAAASPQFHEWLHHDADHHDHDCAVTMLLDNGLHDCGTTVVPVAPPQSNLVEHPIPLSGRSLGSIFLGASIFEHAPPLA